MKKCVSPTHALVVFRYGDTKVVPISFITPVGGAMPCPLLQVYLLQQSLPGAPYSRVVVNGMACHCLALCWSSGWAPAGGLCLAGREVALFLRPLTWPFLCSGPQSVMWLHNCTDLLALHTEDLVALQTIMVEAAAVTAGALEILTAKDYIKTFNNKGRGGAFLALQSVMSDLSAITHLPLNIHSTGELGCVPTCL